MALQAGARVGPYEIVGALGAGAMGEVYRARDPRLGREVALKVLPSAVAQDPDRLRRFAVEARAAGALSHPGILAVYDVGHEDGVRYVASELLEGDTLRERLSAGGLTLRKAIDVAVQVAHALSAAHDKGIVHRDLKPENLFVTRDGRAKILDFGLARQAEPAGPVHDGPTRSHDDATGSGVVMGTVGYMSPEQVRGLPADARSDIFALGCVLYEMLGRRRAFRGETAAETMTAILREDPPSLDALDPSVPPSLDRIVKRCLEKRAEERFQSSRDVAFALEALSTGSTRTLAVPEEPPRRRRLLTALAVAAAAAALVAVGVLAGSGSAAKEPPAFTQLTFRRGDVNTARFAPDGQTIVYDAAWEGGRREIYTTRADAQESRPLGIQDAIVLSISASEMALAVDPVFHSSYPVDGTLARVSLAGGAPRPILEDVTGADWSRDGAGMAVVRVVDGKWRVEYPIGAVLYEGESYINSPAVSPDGTEVAFAEFSMSEPGMSSVVLIDAARRRRVLSADHVAARPFWSPDGREIWLKAAEGGSTTIYAVDRRGRRRVVMRFPGAGKLADVSPDGRVLYGQSATRVSVFVRATGARADVDLSWLDASNLADISADGRTLVFSETMGGGGRRYGVYLRRTDGSPAVRLGEGRAYALSPDGKWVLTTVSGGERPRIVLVPTGAGEAREIPNTVVGDFRGGSFFPGSGQVVFSGKAGADGVRLFVADIEGGAPRPLGPPGLHVEFPVVSPDGRALAGANADGDAVVVPLDDPRLKLVEAAGPGEIPVQWSADSRSLYVYRPDEIPARVYRVSVEGEHRELFREITVADPTGLDGRMTVVMAPDGASYAYSFARTLVTLFLVTGLR